MAAVLEAELRPAIGAAPAAPLLVAFAPELAAPLLELESPPAQLAFVLKPVSRAR